MCNGFIESRISTPVTLTTNDSIVTFQNDTRTRSTLGCDGWLCHSEGSPIYKIVKAGYYDIGFSGVLYSATAGIVAIGLYIDGVLDPSTVRFENVGAGGSGSVSFNKIEKVCCKANSTISIGAVPSVDVAGTATATVAPTINSALLNITKLS